MHLLSFNSLCLSKNHNTPLTVQKQKESHNQTPFCFKTNNFNTKIPAEQKFDMKMFYLPPELSTKFWSLSQVTPDSISLHLICAVLLAVTTVCASLLILLVRNHTKAKRAPLPPGPAPWALIGNLPEIWKNRPTFKWIHQTMQELNTEIACIRVANTHIIPVTSPEIAREFLKKYDAFVASRPVTMGTEYCSRGFLSIAVVPQGEQWKKMRKIVNSHIINQGILRWLLHKRNEEHDNLIRFVHNQCRKSVGESALINLRLVTRQYSGNMIRKMMFSKRYYGKGSEDGGPGPEEEELVEALFTVLNHLYTFVVSDYVPWLRPFDLEGHEKIVSEAKRTIDKYNDVLVDERVQEWRDGKRMKPQDLIDMFIQVNHTNGERELSVEEIKAQCTELMLAVVDNPSNAVEWAMAEMLNNPILLQKATDEIDKVVGKDRLVQESDVPELNYIKACVKEAFRLHPIAPFNLPHMSTRNINVAGYHIPKGSHILLSRIGLGRNPRVWDKPYNFMPERHLGGGCVEVNEPDLRFISFSTGRRGCMGVSLGTTMTVVLLARLLQGFTWTAPEVKKIDLSESKNDLFLATPLHALAKPRLQHSVYPR